MNYKKHYMMLMETRKLRVKNSDTYYENHHILPRSMGGSNDPENLVLLTVREHFIAHWLLWRIHRNEEMARAFFCMHFFKNSKKQGLERKIFSSIAYEEARISFIEKMKNDASTKMRECWKRDHYRKIMKEARKGCQTGKFVSDETKNKMQSSRTRHCVKVTTTHKKTGDKLHFDKVADAARALKVNYRDIFANRLEEYEVKLVREDYLFVSKNRKVEEFVFEKENVQTVVRGIQEAIQFAKLRSIPVAFVRYKKYRDREYDGWSFRRE
jgi:hypothetical protein